MICHYDSNRKEVILIAGYDKEKTVNHLVVELLRKAKEASHITKIEYSKLETGICPSGDYKQMRYFKGFTLDKPVGSIAVNGIDITG